MPQSSISPREKEVLVLISQEYTTKEIAHQLFISEHTAISHRKNLFRKLGSRNIAGLIRHAYEAGLLRVQLSCMALMLSWSVVQAQVHPDDLAALQALYIETDGDNWTNNEGWATIFDPVLPPFFNLSSLHGISVDFVTKRVTSVQLSANDLKGTIPSNIDLLSEVKTFILNQNDLSLTPFQRLSSFRNMSRLEHLAMSRCSLNTIIPHNFWGSPSIKEINFYLNNLRFEGDSLTTDIGQMTSIEILNLGRNKCKGKLPTSIGHCTALRRLIIPENFLEGIIPTSLANLDSLEQLNLSFNNLSGTIDTLINEADWPILESINLSYNQLHGHIPDMLFKFENLFSLALNNNQLSGNLPNMRDHEHLRFIILSNNNLECYLWPDVDRLTALERLGLNDNQLTGGLPITIASLSNLDYLHLENNALDGCLDTTQLWDFLCNQGIDVSLSGNNFDADPSNWCAIKSGACGPEGPVLITEISSVKDGRWIDAGSWNPQTPPKDCHIATIHDSIYLQPDRFDWVDDPFGSPIPIQVFRFADRVNCSQLEISQGGQLYIPYTATLTVDN